MCGIAGFVNKQAAQDQGEYHLMNMLSRIRHRGPDGDGVLSDAQWGFYAGMRRLSIIDLAGGDQPIHNEDGTVGVLFNGEIYNYIELREGLMARGHLFRTGSDTEVLVHLYEEHGAALVHQLRGMFAFVIYDVRQHRLLIARDHFGQKPLYYTADKQSFAFGSELKSLFALPWVDRALRPGALQDYMAWFSLPAPDTHFQHIRKLAAGSLMEIDLKNPDVFEPRSFWKYTAGQDVLIDDLEHGADLLDEAFDQSIRVHLRSDVPVGVLLSSGLDSKITGMYAAARHPGGMNTFTAGYADAGSEFSGARATAGVMGSTHYEVVVTAEDLADDISRVAWHLDEPTADAAAFAVLRVCEMARQHVKVLLSGEGSDELFAGYAPRYLGMLDTLTRSDRFRRWARFLPQAKHPFPQDRFGRLCQRASTSLAAEIVQLRVEGLPGDIRQPRGLTLEQLWQHRQRAQEIASRLVRPQRDLLHTLLALDIDWQLADSLLLKADKMSMAASIELRTPFLDVPLASLSARMDSSIKLQADIGKYVLRRCLARRDPNEDMTRPKQGFPIPLAEWFRGPLKDRIADDLFRTQALWPGELDNHLIRTLWDDFQAGKIECARVFYALWMYETWYHRILRPA